jgi:hypothetical protein
MKNRTLFCTLLVLLIAFANAQPPVDVRPDRNGAGRALPPHLRREDELMRGMHERRTERSLSTNANTQPSKATRSLNGSDL